MMHNRATSIRSIPWPLRFGALALIWGLSFLFIRLGIDSFAPLQVAAIRLAVGAVTLLAILTITGDHLPRGRTTWFRLTIGAVFMNVAPFALFAYGEQRVPSLLAGIWNATTPLMTMPIAMLLLADERATRARVLGLLVGFAGVLVVLGVWNGFSDHDVAGDLMCLAAAACYGVGFPYARRFLGGGGESTVALAAGQILVGSVEAGILALVFTSPPAAVRTDSIVAMLALGSLGTGVAYILSWSILRDAGSTVLSSVTYLLPLVAVVAGIVLLGEQLTWNEPVGGMVVIAGALIAQGRLRSLWARFGRRSADRTMQA